jgi:hypothetical protein
MLFPSSNIIPVMKTLRMGWEGHEANMAEIRDAYRILAAKP